MIISDVKSHIERCETPEDAAMLQYELFCRHLEIRTGRREEFAASYAIMAYGAEGFEHDGLEEAMEEAVDLTRLAYKRAGEPVAILDTKKNKLIVGTTTSTKFNHKSHNTTYRAQARVNVTSPVVTGLGLEPRPPINHGFDPYWVAWRSWPKQWEDGYPKRALNVGERSYAIGSKAVQDWIGDQSSETAELCVEALHLSGHTIA